MGVVDEEAEGVRGEVEGEARGGGVEGSEHGGGINNLGICRGHWGRNFGWVEEVAEERRGAREAAGGQAAPTVRGERRTEEVGEGEAAENVLEDEVGDVSRQPG